MCVAGSKRSWTLVRLDTGERCHLDLLDRLLALEHADVWASFRQKRFEYGTLGAAADRNLDVLLWWATKYLPGHPSEYSLIADAAARHGFCSGCRRSASSATRIRSPDSKSDETV